MGTGPSQPAVEYLADRGRFALLPCDAREVRAADPEECEKTKRYCDVRDNEQQYRTAPSNVPPCRRTPCSCIGNGWHRHLVGDSAYCCE
ncbi:MAG: hypothetical protein JSV78_03900 [Phycisphaerales bacterium]|nr:MAG: hypothetical protein JSV78_03900 [Phycisphaerales bacterium]